MAKKKTESNGATLALDLIVSFGNVSIGDKTARIGVAVDRSSLTVSNADKSLCGRRLTGKIVSQPAGDAPGQETLPGFESGNTDLATSFDVKSFSVTPKNIAFGLTFSLRDLDIGLLGNFAKRNGRLQVSEITDLPEDEEGGGDSEE